MSDFSRQSYHIARKDYRCDACIWLRNAIGKGDLTFSELRRVARAKRDNWKIKKGQIYLKHKGIHDGEWYVFRARIAINQICLDQDYYREWRSG